MNNNQWVWKKIAQHSALTEGPLWNGKVLLYNECAKQITWCYNPETEQVAEWRTNTGGANGMCFDAKGNLYCCEGLAHRVTKIPNNTKIPKSLASQFKGSIFNAPNDIAITSNGKIYFSDPNYSQNPNSIPQESVYMIKSVDNTWVTSRVTYDTHKPNGVLLSIDESTLFVADSPKNPKAQRELRAYPINSNGLLKDYTVLHNFGVGRGIDGMTMTKHGIIVATAGEHLKGPGPMIYLFEESGRVLYTVRTPADYPTNCTFGGKDLDILYVTFGGGEVYKVLNTNLIGYPNLLYNNQ